MMCMFDITIDLPKSTCDFAKATTVSHQHPNQPNKTTQIIKTTKLTISINTENRISRESKNLDLDQSLYCASLLTASRWREYVNSENVGTVVRKRSFWNGMGLSVEREKSVLELQNQNKRGFDFITDFTTFSAIETQFDCIMVTLSVHFSYWFISMLSTNKFGFSRTNCQVGLYQLANGDPILGRRIIIYTKVFFICSFKSIILQTKTNYLLISLNLVNKGHIFTIERNLLEQLFKIKFFFFFW